MTCHRIQWTRQTLLLLTALGLLTTACTFLSDDTKEGTRAASATAEPTEVSAESDPQTSSSATGTTDTQPESPLAVSSDAQAEQVRAELATASAIRIEHWLHSDLFADSPVLITVSERAHIDGPERHQWDRRQLVDYFIESDELAEKLYSTPDTRGLGIGRAAWTSMALDWQFEGECRISEDSIARTTIDLEDGEIWTRTVERMPHNETWEPEFSDPFVIRILLGSGADPSKRWTRRFGSTGTSCSPIETGLKPHLEHLMSRWENRDTTVELDDQGRLSRIVTLDAREFDYLREVDTYENEFIITYAVEDEIEFPDEADIHQY